MRNATWDSPQPDLRSLTEADKDFCTMARLVNEQKLVIAVLSSEVERGRDRIYVLENDNLALKANLAQMTMFKQKAS